MDSPAQDLTTRPISEHNGDLVCILVKVMPFDNVLVHLGALVVAGDGAQVSVRLVFSHISCTCTAAPRPRQQVRSVCTCGMPGTFHGSHTVISGRGELQTCKIVMQRSDNEQTGQVSTDNLLTELVSTNGAILVDEAHLEALTRYS